MPFQPYSRARAARLSRAQRSLLIEHVDGPLPVTATARSQTRKILLALALVCPCRADGSPLPEGTARPPFTKLTDIGRDVVCAAMSLEIERLARLGCAAPEAPPVTLVPSGDAGTCTAPVPTLTDF